MVAVVIVKTVNKFNMLFEELKRLKKGDIVIANSPGMFRNYGTICTVLFVDLESRILEFSAIVDGVHKRWASPMQYFDVLYVDELGKALFTEKK